MSKKLRTTFVDNIEKLNKGAGVLSGDLFVCGLIIKKDDLTKLSGVNDSKKLTEKKRELLYPEIIAKALDYCIIHISPQEVDRINILEARKLGVAKLSRD